MVFMIERKRRGLSAEQKAELWKRLLAAARFAKSIPFASREMPQRIVWTPAALSWAKTVFWSATLARIGLTTFTPTTTS